MNVLEQPNFTTLYMDKDRGIEVVRMRDSFIVYHSNGNQNWFKTHTAMKAYLKTLLPASEMILIR